MSTEKRDPLWTWWKRLLCVVHIHWNGRSDGGGMGDAISCRICNCDYYGLGIVVNDEGKL